MAAVTESKIAVITGASRGLGEGMARHLTRAGVTVIGTSRQPVVVSDLVPVWRLADQQGQQLLRVTCR
ncbi:SDR family NAD(P)-dependent oxidoreductase [Actinoplanes sp. NBRC 103695]|uniref:SDR family NAD(P)-dependent oxidoreductase n=1 Tax=Actinoplanes sp. NBRC 103695 TaxID=3032202 RepID=UPI0033317B76